jgi:hypothetical protein
MSETAKQLIYTLVIYVVFVGGWWLWDAVK